MALEKKRRLSSAAITKLFKQGKTVKSSFFFIRRLPNRLLVSRFAVIAPGKVFRRAVVRNRYKRMVTELLKELVVGYGGIDLVVILAPSILRKSRSEIKGEWEKNIKPIFVNQ